MSGSSYKDFVIAKYHFHKILMEFGYNPPEKIIMSPSGESMTWEELKKEYERVWDEKTTLL